MEVSLLRVDEFVKFNEKYALNDWIGDKYY